MGEKSRIIRVKQEGENLVCGCVPGFSSRGRRWRARYCGDERKGVMCVCVRVCVRRQCGMTLLFFCARCRLFPACLVVLVGLRSCPRFFVVVVGAGKAWAVRGGDAVTQTEPTGTTETAAAERQAPEKKKKKKKEATSVGGTVQWNAGLTRIYRDGAAFGSNGRTEGLGWVRNGDVRIATVRCAVSVS
jgi:hypothetical protein